jgi:uncharacterized protein (TIGR02145 family)
LNSNTTYYVRAYATNIVGTAYGNDDSLTTYTGTVTDCDGNIYYTITIGTQVWMDENLMTTHYRTGCAAIPYVSGSAWNSESTGAYTYYATYDTTTLGLLYNWYTITNSDSLCPVGFHVPDSTEWGTLIKHVGGYGSAGGALKVTGTTYWASPNTGATNSSGFSAYGGGYYNGSATDATDDGNYWTSTSTGTKGYYIYMYYGASYVQKNTSSKTLGYSVRCIKN